MSEVIGRGVIEVSADSTKLKAGIDDAKRTIRSLGDANKDASTKASQSIDRYIKRLEVQQKTIGMSARETELYKLTLRGASAEQLKAADTALKLTEAYEKGTVIGEKIRASFIAIGLAAGTGLIAAYVAFDQLVKKAGDFQDMAEKTGDTAENIASLSVAAGTAGVQMEVVVGASEKLTKSLTGVDDESKAAGAAIAALGLNLKDFKALAPADQFEAVGKALNGFEDGASKTAVAMALFGKSGAELLPFLKEVGAEGGRQIILTQKQIELADEYADKQAKLHAQISLYAQAIATDLLPAMNEYKAAIASILKDQEHSATASNLLKAAMSGLVTVFQTIAIIASDVGFTFQGLGREIGAVLAQSNALAHLDLKGFKAISAAVKEDGIRARAELDKFQARIMAIDKPGAVTDPTNYSNEGRGAAVNSPPKLNFNGATPSGPSAKDTAAQEAKAQLAFDLEQIKKASEAVTNTYSNAEKIMEARRAANLIDERDYYASKLGFLNLNSAEQEKALQQEIARMQQEQLIGKAKIDNDRKIVEAQAKLAKVRADAVAGVTVNSIQEEAANKKIAQSYIDATKAAEAYIDTIRRQNAREIDGIGKGEAFRANQAGRGAIEDKQTTQRQGLEGDLRRGQINQEQFDTYLAVVNDTYAKEVAAYDARTAAIKEKQADWLNGASEAFANYQSNAENVAGNSAAMFQQAFDGLTDGVAQSVSAAILSGKSLEDSLKNVALNIADAFITSFIKMQIQKMFIDKTAATMYAGTIAAQSQAMVAMAGLAAFASTAAIPIVGPMLAPGAAAAATALAEGFAVAATAAASMSIASARGGFDIPAGVNPITQLHEKEMVLPAPQANVIRDLAKNGGDSGKSGAGPITIVNNTSAKIGKVTEQRLSNGERALIIEEAVAATAAQFSDPNSKASRSISRNFNVPRSR